MTQTVDLGDTIKSEKELETALAEAGVVPGDDKDGCGNCYGAGYSGQCCQTCDDVRNAYAAKGWRFNPQGIAQCQRANVVDDLAGKFAQSGGCAVYGHINLPNAVGEFHFAPHKAHTAAKAPEGVLSLLDFIGFTFDQFNITHTVRTFPTAPHPHPNPNP